MTSTSESDSIEKGASSPEVVPQSDNDRSDPDRAAEVAAVLAAAERASTPRRWPALVIGVVIGGVGALAGVAYWGGQEDDSVFEREEIALATAPVEQRDLLEEIEWAGTLGYGQPISVSWPASGSGAGGTVTSTAARGVAVERGDVIATVDGEPVVVLFGDAPLWRSLAEGDEGPDVQLLEANLAALGYDPDQAVDIDQLYTANTEAMVERWQDDLGLVDPTGEVVIGSVVIVEGPSTLVSVAEVGASAGGELATLAPRRAVTDVVAAIDGTITSLLAVGETIEHGSILYTVDGVEVQALTDLDAISSELMSTAFTNTELEQALVDAGYDPDGEITVDETSTDATGAAVTRWQVDTGLTASGRTDPGYYTLVPVGRVVEAHLIDEDAVVVAGGPLLVASASRLSVEVVVDVGDADEFEVGQEVVIELADESTVDGVVVELSSIIQSTQPQGSPTVEIMIGVVGENTNQDLIEGPVTVISVGEAVEGATVVPTRALVSLAEGGFAVERVDADGSKRLIGIEIGTFDDGVVEVVSVMGGATLAVGDAVVVPQ
ncbi:MAG: hypothetical protein GY939_05650 [Actinomycetia bacterium]|nr:hypothetical protein [Actinomycetes bacterium]